MNQHLLENAGILIDKAKFEKYLENATTREDIIEICEKYLSKYKSQTKTTPSPMPLPVPISTRILNDGKITYRTLAKRETIADYVFEGLAIKDKQDYVTDHVIRNMCKDIGMKIYEDRCYKFYAERDIGIDATHYVIEVIIGEKQ